MDYLIAQLRRLYFLDDQRCVLETGGECAPSADVVVQCLAGGPSAALDQIGADGRVRALVVAFENAADWPYVARLYQAVQDDLDLPAPALAIGGRYAVWFSLAHAAPAAQASAFLAALCARYLADLPAKRVGLYPADATPARVALTPGRNAVSGQWSAFIDPTLGSMFIDDPWLEMAPNPDKQAELLGALKSIAPAAFEAALRALQSDPTVLEAAPAAVRVETRRRRSALNVGSGYRDPQSFLLAVMNDTSASARHRIAAAKALLPCFAAKPTN
jgi:hypothetical protein